MHQKTTDMTKIAAEAGIIDGIRRQLHDKSVGIKVGTTNGRLVAHIRHEEKDNDGRVTAVEGTTVRVDQLSTHPLYNQHHKED